MTVRLLAVALAAVVALTAAPAPAATPGEVKYGNKIIKLVNNIRDNHDRVELRKNKCLQRFANRQAERMAKQRRLFHQDLGRSSAPAASGTSARTSPGAPSPPSRWCGCG